MTHSKPRLISVGWSMTSSPGLTLMTIAWPVVLPAKPGAVDTASATNSIMFFIGRSWDMSIGLGLARSPRRDVSVDELERAFDRFDDHRLHLGSVPVGIDVTERGIEEGVNA